MTESKYKSGKIYKITDIGYTKCYTGSTIDSLSSRMSKHRCNYKQYLNSNGGSCSAFNLFDEFGVQNCKIELIELASCNSRMELTRLEGKSIREYDCINKLIAGRTRSEYNHDMADVMKQKRLSYYYENQEQECARSRLYKENNKERVALYRKHHDATRCICECGTDVRRADINRHRKSHLHMRLMEP
jgi:hypothetical protein